MLEITVRPDGGTIRSLRTAKKWTQEKLADKAGCHKRTVENAEAGKRVKEAYLEYIAEALGVSPQALVLPDQGPATGEPVHRVFVSYSRVDLALVTPIIQVIRALGVT